MVKKNCSHAGLLEYINAVTAVARYQAGDLERRRPGPARLGYHSAKCTGGGSQDTAKVGSNLVTRCGY